MQTTIEMPDELFRKAEAVAALRGQSMKQFITQLLDHRDWNPCGGLRRGQNKSGR